MMVGRGSLELLSINVIYECGQVSGWSFTHYMEHTRTMLELLLHNDCKVIFPPEPTGPLVTSKPDPARWGRASEARSREVLQCMTAPFSTLSICEGEDCEETDAEVWLLAHPEAQ